MPHDSALGTTAVTASIHFLRFYGPIRIFGGWIPGNTYVVMYVPIGGLQEKMNIGISFRSTSAPLPLFTPDDPLCVLRDWRGLSKKIFYVSESGFRARGDYPWPFGVYSLKSIIVKSVRRIE